MSLRLKFNLVMIFAFAVGLVLSGYLSKELILKSARAQMLKEATIMMEAAKSILRYTEDQIRPLFPNEKQFHPQSVPAYAAAQSFELIKNRFPDYSFKETSVNPTNPTKRATDWETDIIKYFENNPGEKFYSGQRDTPTGSYIYLSEPLFVEDASCLACHGKPENAPASLVKLYGDNNGFGWDIGQVMGAQIMNIPMDEALAHARESQQTFLILLSAVFFFIWLVLNILLHFFVLKPIRSMADNANAISTGAMNTPEFKADGKDEIASLGASFNRMYRSLSSAFKIIEKTKG